MRKVLLMLLVAALLITGSSLAESDGVLTSGDFSYRLCEKFYHHCSGRQLCRSLRSRKRI